MEDNRLPRDIRRSSLEEFWIWRHGTVKNKLMMLKRIHKVGDEVLGLVEGLPDIISLPLRYEIGMGVDCVNLSTRKGKYADHL